MISGERKGETRVTYLFRPRRIEGREREGDGGK